MAAPKEVLWRLQPHTAAKHRIVRRYLDAWFPIMAKYNAELVVVDGFAGPGEYRDGEQGSPFVMLDSLRLHKQVDRIVRRRVRFIFIEGRADRMAHLNELVSTTKVPANVTITVRQGRYSDAMREVLQGVDSTMFAFIDPFGFSDTHLDITTGILDFPKCEVLIYVPIRAIARFIDKAQNDVALTNLYGTDAWKAARMLDGYRRQQLLLDLFAEALGHHAKHVRSFEIAQGGYHLFFGTNHVLGLEKMVDAFWAVDPDGGAAYTPLASPDGFGQMTMFDPEPDYAALRRELEAEYGDRWFSIEDALLFTLLKTRFQTSHLKTRTLGQLERDGRLEVARPSPVKVAIGTYPKGTRLRILPRK